MAARDPEGGDRERTDCLRATLIDFWRRQGLAGDDTERIGAGGWNKCGLARVVFIGA